MMKEVSPRNYQYDQAQLTSVVVAETTSRLIHDRFVAGRKLSKIGDETPCPEAYAAAETECRDATSRFYGFLIRFAAARLSDDHELLERASHWIAIRQQSQKLLEASRPEWFVAQMTSDQSCLLKAS